MRLDLRSIFPIREIVEEKQKEPVLRPESERKARFVLATNYFVTSLI